MKKSEETGQKRLGNLLYAVKSYFSVQANVLIVVFAVLLLVLTVYPMYSVIRSSITVSRMEAMRYNSLFHTKLSEGDFTLLNFQTLLNNQAAFWKPLWNSLRMSAYASIIAILVGGTFAFLITRTDISFKKFFSSVFIFPYIMPSWTLALVWKNVFANSQIGSGVVGMLESLTGLCVPGWVVYGIFPCSLVMGIHYAPFAYILIGGTLRNMDANLEEAATILQSSRWRILRKITIPIVMPALFSTVLLVFSSTMASYAVPVFVGSPGNFFVLSTQLSALYNSMTTKGQAFVLTIVLILFGVILLGINQWFTGKRKSFTTVTGKSGQVSYIKLGKANAVISVVLAVVLFLIAIFPIISFALESMVDSHGNYSTLTLKYWLSREDIGGFAVNAGPGILFNSRIWTALWGSIRLSLIVSLIGTAVGLALGLVVGGFRAAKLDITAAPAARFFKKLFDVIANIYITVFRGTPMMVQAVFIYYALLNVVHWDTLTAAIVVISVNTGAYMAEIIRSGIQAVDSGQTEAARSLGMSNSQTMFSVVLPQAIRNAFPAIGNELIVNIKDSSVLMIISITELMFQAKSIAGSTFHFTETYFIEAMIYLLLTSIASIILNIIEKRMNRTTMTIPMSDTDPSNAGLMENKQG